MLSRFIFACRLVLYLYACAVENPEILGFCVSKSRGLRTDHKRVKKIETFCCSVTQTNKTEQYNSRCFVVLKRIVTMQWSRVKIFEFVFYCLTSIFFVLFLRDKFDVFIILSKLLNLKKYVPFMEICIPMERSNLSLTKCSIIR